MDKSQNKRIVEYDCLRTIACLMVVMMHAPIPSAYGNSLFLSTLSYMTAPCIGIFFMISGALLLPVGQVFPFINRRLTKVIFPTLFWSIFYLFISVYQNGFDFLVLIQKILSIPFSPQGNGVLWFMYTLIGLYLVSPIISKWIMSSSKKEIEFYLILWIISLLYPLIDNYITVATDRTNILYYFSGYLGYYVLGFYLKKYPQVLKTKRICLTVLIAVLVPICCKLFNWQVDFYSVFWYLSIFVVILCIGWYKFVFKLCSIVPIHKFQKYILSFSNLSFGIYFVHIFIMRTILWKQKWIINIDNYILQSLVVILLTVLLSYIACRIISYLPKAEYIIGYKQKER